MRMMNSNSPTITTHEFTNLHFLGNNMTATTIIIISINIHFNYKQIQQSEKISSDTPREVEDEEGRSCW